MGKVIDFLKKKKEKDDAHEQTLIQRIRDRAKFITRILDIQAEQLDKGDDDGRDN